MDSKLIKHKAFPKTLLLKDYLLDDMSSCSSNGFNSFPRKQCFTTTVRFLIDIDLDNIKQPNKYLIFNKRKYKPSKSAISAFQSVIAAVKRIPFSAVGGSPEKNGLKKILMKSVFWKRKSNYDEIGRWKSLDQLLKEGSESLDIPNSSIMAAAATTNDSGNSSSEVNQSFTEVKRNDDDYGGNDDDDVEVIKDRDVSADSTTSSDGGVTRSSTKMQWAVSGEKEQFSPVSVLDCPFDDDEEVSSPFQHMEGTTKKLMEKMKRFECLAQLEPLNLSKRFALLPDSDNESGSPRPHSSASSVAISSIKEEEEDETGRAEEKAPDLLQQLMDSVPLSGLDIKADKLLLDFFREKIMDRNLHCQKHSFVEEAVEEVERWMNGRKIREAFLGWEVQRSRQAYMKDMERSGEWRCLEQEIGEMGLELEAVVFDALFDELVVDISSTTTL